MKALSAHKCLFKKSTQCFSKAGTAYFLAVYNVVMTAKEYESNAINKLVLAIPHNYVPVSGPI